MHKNVHPSIHTYMHKAYTYIQLCFNAQFLLSDCLIIVILHLFVVTSIAVFNMAVWTGSLLHPCSFLCRCVMLKKCMPAELDGRLDFVHGVISWLTPSWHLLRIIQMEVRTRSVLQSSPGTRSSPPHCQVLIC